MTTPALPADILTKIRAGHQAVRFRALLSEIVQFRAFCCNLDSDDVMGVTKTPVIDLQLSPNPVCLGSAVDYDLTDSYAPGSAIVSYDIDMGDGTSYSNSSGSHTYAAVGTYNVVARVVEGLGKYQTAKAQVVVVDCSEPTLISYTYLATYGHGVYFIDWKATTPAWVARNTGLTGTGLYVNSLVMNPNTRHLPYQVHELWAATDGGLYHTFNGGISWSHVPMPNPSNAEFGDAPPATVGELYFLKAVGSKVNPNLMWVLAGKTSPARMWVYRSANSGLTWTSRGLMV